MLRVHGKEPSQVQSPSFHRGRGPSLSTGLALAAVLSLGAAFLSSTWLARRRAWTLIRERQIKEPISTSDAQDAHPLPPDHYLVLQDASFGRFSNNRLMFLEAAALANYTGRVLLTPRLGSCPDNDTGTLYNLASLTRGEGGLLAADDVPSSDLSARCGPRGTYVVVESIAMGGTPRLGAQGTMAKWRGVEWTIVNSLDVPFNASLVPPALQLALNVSVLQSLEPYASHFPAEGHLHKYLSNPTLPFRLVGLANTRCIAIPRLFQNVNFAVMPGSFEGLLSALQPSPRIERLVSEWMAAAGVPQQAAVGVHLRIGDLGSRGFAGECEADPAFVVAAIKRLYVIFPGAASLPLLIASDSFGRGRCVPAVIAAFPHHIRLSKIPLGCEGLVFTQEVLARTVGFLGNSESTFSMAISNTRVLRYGHALESSVWPRAKL